MFRTQSNGGAISLCHLEAGLLLCRTEAVAKIKEDPKRCLRSTQHKPRSIPCRLGDLGLLTQAFLNLSNCRDECCRIRGWIHLPMFDITQSPAHKPGVENMKSPCHVSFKFFFLIFFFLFIIIIIFTLQFLYWLCHTST